MAVAARDQVWIMVNANSLFVTVSLINIKHRIALTWLIYFQLSLAGAVGRRGQFATQTASDNVFANASRPIPVLKNVKVMNEKFASVMLTHFKLLVLQLVLLLLAVFCW